ncbi:hypothetical protein LOD99_2736 [Oopsacas minuta]|uniref:Uncharacterized protein n=1 Tax=Oopsacas minuta TaxID=111878 RepID=A0AAV7K0W6_9METZ|nr:hypothetical protein LOD99_2736 [Oopsacas minuta]
MISLISSLRIGQRKNSTINGSMTDLMNPKKSIFFTPTRASNNTKGPKWCMRHNLVCLNTIPAPSFQNSMICEDYVVVKSSTDRYKDLFIDPLPEVPSYIAAPPPLKSLPISKSMSDIMSSSGQKIYKSSPLSEMSFASKILPKDDEIVEGDSDSSEEIDPRIYNNPPPPLKLHKNLPVMQVH